MVEKKANVLFRDILARRALWSDGLDYRYVPLTHVLLWKQSMNLGISHSTSHGIGSFLNVHEGPQGVGQRPAYNEVALQEGMVISNEPGYYKDGEWGIRIEGVDVIERRETRENFGGKGWLGLERITMVSYKMYLMRPRSFSYLSSVLSRQSSWILRCSALKKKTGSTNITQKSSQSWHRC